MLLLCDGCGSSKYSLEAAHRITNRLADCVSYPERLINVDNSFDTEDFLHYCASPNNEEAFMWLFINEIRREVKELCALYQCRQSELCCTLIAVLIEYDPKTSKNSAVVITIGDGFVATYHRKSKLTSLVSRGENRENNPNMTYFCTSADAINHTKIYRIEDFDALLISSDGITHLVDIDSIHELKGFMCKVAESVAQTDTRFTEEMNRLLNSYIEQSPHLLDLEDDCSVVYYSTDKQANRRL